jgi:hypothetical protein
MSTQTTATDASWCAARVIERSRSSSNIARLGSPVSSSWYARKAAVSSARFASVMSNSTPREKIGTPRSSRTIRASSRIHATRPSRRRIR